MSDAPEQEKGEPHFGFRPDRDNPGWMVRPASPIGAFIDIFGAIRVRTEAADRARVRFEPGPLHLNILGSVHGGFLLAIVDQVLFIGPSMLGLARVRGGVTVDCTTQFLAPAGLGAPIDAVVEVLRETGRLVFIRGLLEQDGTKILGFTGLIRKASAR